MQALHEVCKANITVNSFGYMVPWVEEISSKTLGNINNLADTYAPMLHHHLRDNISSLLQ